MIKKRKRGIILILIGIGVLIVFYALTYESREGLKVEIFYQFFSYKYPLAIGLLIILLGVGIVIFSFFPKEEKWKK